MRNDLKLPVHYMTGPIGAPESVCDPDLQAAQVPLWQRTRTIDKATCEDCRMVLHSCSRCNGKGCGLDGPCTDCLGQGVIPL